MDNKNTVEKFENETRMALEKRFNQAIGARRQGDVDGAAELFRGILKVDPRLAEPHLELANLLLDVGQLAEARAHAEEAIKYLESGSQWIDDLSENVLLSLAWNTLAEIIRKIADEDDVVFGDPIEWQKLIQQSKSAYKKATTLDPKNKNAKHWGGLDSHWESAEDEILEDQNEESISELNMGDIFHFPIEPTPPKEDG